MGIHGNEIADGLAKQGTEKKMPEDEDQVPLSVEDHKAAMTRWAMKAWRSDQKHEWYAATKPGSTISQDLNREEQTTISRLKSGHLRTMTFQNGRKTYHQCSLCNQGEASPLHILQCLNLKRESLYTSPRIVIDRLRSKRGPGDA